MKHLSVVAAVLLALSPLVYAKGPTGFGAIQLGMTKEDIETLASTEDVRLEGPMTPYQYKKTSPKPGQDKFDVGLLTPLAAAPMKAVLTFEGGRLIGLSLPLEDASGLLERLSKQITEKYGPGKIEDHRKEEQCIYKNGSNFKLTSGAVSTKWIEETSANERIETSLSDISIEMCPSNLRYGSIGPIKLKNLSIQRVNAAGEPKSKNLF